MEVWKDIDGYIGLYQISNKGNARSLDHYTMGKDGRKYRIKGVGLSNIRNSCGYNIVTLYTNAKPNTQRVHRLVAKMFIPNPEKKSEVNHKNGIRNDNRIENLEWVTRQENMDHAVRTKLIDTKGSKNISAKLTEYLVLEIRDLYKYTGYTQKEIGKLYGVCQASIKDIVNRNKWKHI